MNARALDSLMRDKAAGDELGKVLGKTSAELRAFRPGGSSGPIKGFLYIGPNAFAFVADNRIFQAAEPGDSTRVLIVPYADCRVSSMLSARFAPNATLELDGIGTLMGRRKEIRMLASCLAT